MPPPVQGVPLEGQVVIITGANTGIGYEAAKHFAVRRPRKLIMVCRSEERGRNALTRLKSETGFEDVELWIADLGSFESVKAIKEKINALERLDILVENASVGRFIYEVTRDGWESSLQVNVLGTALHIILHLPKMLETAKTYPGLTPRVVVVSSGTGNTVALPAEALSASCPLEFLNGQEYSRKAIGEQRYSETKMLQIMLVRALQSRVSAITCCTVSPGFCHSELSREATGKFAEQLKQRKEAFALSSEEGSRQLLYAAIGRRHREEELRGAYVSYGAVQPCGEFIRSEGGQRVERRVWDEIVRIIGSVDERANEIIEGHLEV
ncbi:short-chain dehydrogenase [Marasmius fiardii PR-910]|nr:short-chain dehydrogenase [Marasmius fiardii PR-910]